MVVATGAILGPAMRVSLFWGSRRSRTALIVLLLVISLATACMIALQAQYSDASRRAAAESVLRDYSSLVGDEVIRRSAADIGYYGYYPLMTALVKQVEQAGELSVTTKATFLSSQDARLKRSAGLARNYFEMDRATTQIDFAGDEPSADTTAWLRQNLLRVPSQHRDPGFQVFNSQVAGTPRTFVAMSARGPQGRERITGFEVDLLVLQQWFAVTLNRQPLVPPSLGHGKVSNDFVYVSIRDQGGVERFRMGQPWSPNLAVSKPFGDVYQGVFTGFMVETCINGDISRQIVIGGLPKSRRPLFLALLALNAGLIVTAILQLRRETALQQLRDEFVSSVSHELRTPLTQIRMFTETLLLERIRSSDEARRSLQIIDREARRLSQLVENILQFSRAEKKVGFLSKEKRDLAPLVQEIVDDFESAIDSGQAQFECRLDFALVADVDPDAIRQILINLLDNAVKYGRRQQQAIVSLQAHESKAQLSVEDEGPGIPPADRERVFEHFQRLERDRQSAVAGTGIGLSVVKDLVGRHGGRCWVTTGGRGGAKFIVELPLAADEAARAEQTEHSR